MPTRRGGCPDGPARPAPATRPRRRPWDSALTPVLRALLGLACAVVIAGGLRSLGDSVGLAFLALVLVVTVHPVQQWLYDRGVPRWIGVVVLLVVVYALVLGVGAGLALSLVKLVNLLPSYSDQFTALLDQATTELTKAGVTSGQINEVLHGFDTGTVISLAQTVLGDVTEAASDLLLLLLLLLFLAADAAGFPALLAQASADRPHLGAALGEFARATRRFLVVSTVFGVIAAALQVAALSWLAVPLPLLWGLVSLLATYIANVGFIISVLPPALLALLENGPTNALLVVLAYGVIAFVVQSVVQPRYIANAVGLSVTLSFVSLVVWGYVLGSLGALLAVPLSLLVRALVLDANPRAHWLLPLVAGSADNPHSRPSQPELDDPPTTE